MRSQTLITCVLLAVSVLLSGCNITTTSPTATIEPIVEITNSPSPTATIRLEVTPSPPPPSPTEPVTVQLYTPSPTPTLFPTETLLATETPGYWEHVVQLGETLGYIIQQSPYDYPYDQAVIDAVVRLNNIPNPDNLLVGSTIQIPRPTPTPITASGEATSVFSTSRVVNAGTLPENTVYGCHPVQQGETAVGIVEQYGGLTLALLSQLNDDVDFGGCDFESPSGGPNCNPFISEGQCLIVPFPTPTPTPSPTPSGNETATPTPTFAAPNMIYPPQNGIALPGIVILQWVSVGILQPEEYYLVRVVDVTSGAQPWLGITKSTSIALPETLIPSDGQTHSVEWSVLVGKANEQGLYVPVSGVGNPRTFQWQSR